MTSRLLAWLLAAACVGLVTVATAQSPAPGQSPFKGYLAAGTAPDGLRILPSPPRPDSKREAGDREVFAATRALAGKPRWNLAISDADLAQGPDMFSCAIGVKLNATTAPVTATILRNVSLDARTVIDPPKDHYGRARPYTEPGATASPVCVPKSDALTKNPSYPSGHSTLSWTWGLILAELAPDRATQILGRARSIGDSRVVCGVHYPSDVEAGRTLGASLVAALHGDARFRSDLEHARAELASLRGGPHDGPVNCAVQDEAAAHAPY